MFRRLDASMTFASHEYECGDDATRARFNFREGFQSPDNRSHANDGARAVFVFQQPSRSCSELTRMTSASSPSFASSKKRSLMTRRRAWRHLTTHDTIRLADGQSRFARRLQELAAAAKSRGISIRFGSASACGHTAASLDLADGLSLLGCHKHKCLGFGRNGSAAYLKFLRHKRRIRLRNFK